VAQVRQLEPCPHGHSCRAHAILTTRNVVADLTNYDAAAKIELRWKRARDVSVRVGFPDDDTCRCLIGYAILEMTGWLKRATPPTIDEIAHIGRALGVAVGGRRRTVVEFLSPAPPPWLPTRFL
jgi:hypothetical protein